MNRREFFGCIGFGAAASLNDNIATTQAKAVHSAPRPASFVDFKECEGAIDRELKRLSQKTSAATAGVIQFCRRRNASRLDRESPETLSSSGIPVRCYETGLMRGQKSIGIGTRRTKTKQEYSADIGVFLANEVVVAARTSAIKMASRAASALGRHVVQHKRGVRPSCASINQLLHTMGDARAQIASFVMPSMVLYGLTKDTITEYPRTTVAGMTAYNCVAPAFERDVIISCNDPDIGDTVHGRRYELLGLGRNAVSVEIVDTKIATSPLFTYGGHAPCFFIGCDFWYRVDIKGMTWNEDTRWTQAADDHRGVPIIKGEFTTG